MKNEQKYSKSELISLFESKMISLIESNMSAKGEFRSRANEESPERVNRAKRLAFSKFRDVKINDGKQIVVRFETASSTYRESGHTYTNLIVIPGLAVSYKENPSYANVASNLVNRDVQVKCNCADFKFRYEYWLNNKGSLARVGDSTEQYAISNRPEETNPDDDKGPFCKHLIAVTSVFLPNLSNISKAISSLDLDGVVEQVEENENRSEGMISLRKEDDEFAKAIMGEPGELEERLQKDKGLTEDQREEVVDELTKESDPEEVHEELVDEDDVDLEKAEIDAMNEIEPDDMELEKESGEIELEKDDGVSLSKELDDSEESEEDRTLEKDKTEFDANGF